MNTRIGLAALLVACILILGFWTVGYFEVSSYEKHFVKQFEEQGFTCELKGRKTVGFPYKIERSIEQIILKAKKDTNTAFISVEGVTITKTAWNPGQVFLGAKLLRGSLNREHHIQINTIRTKHATPVPKSGVADSLMFDSLDITSHGVQIATLGKSQVSQGVKNSTLHLSGDASALRIGDQEFASLDIKAFLETPLKEWGQIHGIVTSALTSLYADMESAIHAGQRTLPRVQMWMDHLEETQAALHLDVTLKESGTDSMCASCSLGIVEGLPSGKASLRGSGPYFTAHQLKNTEWVIRKEGVFENEKLLYAFDTPLWEEQHLIDESFICDKLGLYPHGVFRQLLAEGEQETEKPDVQFAVGEGYLIDGVYKKALTWFKRAAIQKHPKALLHLGYMYYYGFGCEPNKVLAREFTEDSLCFGGNLHADLKEFDDPSFCSWANEVTGEVVAEGKYR